VLEAIFWKPEFAWRVEEIWVLNEIRYFSILRNEVNGRASERSAREWAQRGGGYVASEDRAQRQTLALREVAYVIRARPEPATSDVNDAAKYRDQFRRRVGRGQCFAPPYLGCREFGAAFGPVDGSERPIGRTEDLGRMLLGVSYAADGSGQGAPGFFEARLTDGVLRVPASGAEEG